MLDLNLYHSAKITMCIKTYFQNPYPWGMPAPVVGPYEVINNYNMEQPVQPQQQQQLSSPLPPAPVPVQSQPAAVYAAPRHH